MSPSMRFIETYLDPRLDTTIDPRLEQFIDLRVNLEVEMNVKLRFGQGITLGFDVRFTAGMDLNLMRPNTFIGFKTFSFSYRIENLGRSNTITFTIDMRTDELGQLKIGVVDFEVPNLEIEVRTVRIF